ncbi:SDR family oxidoreductase [Actinotalea sp. M2MS4P-6]|uniref:SDR family NAD(P)-dependent oxidoreductase n=1 Tax=Actinotalea sp. M2MS4P-6 TaxID=2983762 RepID=UPI0021E4ED6E|nr:SDR family oxidoreductase [Actinotalea sp. M2MS4P-6]MCV2394443.1 SDR family oxidoreductase [Actinotalea sp. M2MS4P-6]
MQLEGKRIIVTGGAQGMGEATVRAYLAEGARVAAMDVQDEAGHAVVESAAADGAGAYFHVDVADRGAVEDGFAEAVSWLGGLDVLAHVAGVIRTQRPEEIDDASWDLVMNVNVKGTMLTNQAAFRAMQEQGSGAIINFGSVSGLRAEPRGAIYSASKGAVHSWTRTVAAAWGRSGIRVNAILPIIATPMYEKNRASMTPAQLERFTRETEQAIPLGGRYGDADRDLAPVMVFFASEASRFITGQLIPVDGGLASVR